MANTATIQLGTTVYGGEVNWDTGVGTIDRGFATYSGANAENWRQHPGKAWQFIADAPSDIKLGGATSYYIKKCNQLEITAAIWDSSNYGIVNSQDTIVIGMPNIADITALATYLSSHNLQICYELATPTTIQLTPTMLEMLKGYNRITLSNGYGTIELKALTGANWS